MPLFTEHDLLRNQILLQCLPNLPKHTCTLIVQYTQRRKQPMSSISAQTLPLKDTIRILIQQSFVICRSAKTRRQVYKYLHARNISFQRQIIGHTDQRKLVWRPPNGIGWSVGRLVKWVESKRILQEDVRDISNDLGKHDQWHVAEQDHTCCYHWTDLQRIMFPPSSVSFRERCRLLQNFIDERKNLNSYHTPPFEWLELRCTIVKISLRP